MKNKKNKDDCTELKNIKYQNMLLSNSKFIDEKKENVNDIDDFLTKEKKENKLKPWNKLGKSSKIKLIKNFIIKYKNNNNLDDETNEKLKVFLYKCIERKKLQKIKDIKYDKIKEIIIDIPNLFFNKKTKKFVLKKNEKRISTLKSLAPKSKRRKNKITNKTEKRKSPKKKKKDKQKEQKE
tara:strand:+ start:110 stop:652 length:543 start_codon:yes stop_codon:yes gene_type:complete